MLCIDNTLVRSAVAASNDDIIVNFAQEMLEKSLPPFRKMTLGQGVHGRAGDEEAVVPGR